MKNLLTKILFISLLLSAVAPSTVQANLLDWACALRDGAVGNYLSTNSGNFYNFLTKHSVAVKKYSIAVAVGVTSLVALKKVFWKPLLKEVIQNHLDHNLGEAIENNNIVKVRLALKMGANVNSQNSYWTPLTLAVIRGRLELVKLLLTHDADVNKKITVNWTGLNDLTVLMVAGIFGHLKIAERLLANGADVDMQCGDGHTALMKVARVEKYSTGNLKMAKLLVNNNADVDKQDNDGCTALMHAAVQEAKHAGNAADAADAAAQKAANDIIKLLLDAGADPLIKGKDGTIALEKASNEAKEIMRNFVAQRRQKAAKELMDVEKELPKGPADLISEFAYSLPECEPVQ